jgi:TRAP-type C4-dicarboxylate transport system permease small subunit
MKIIEGLDNLLTRIERWLIVILLSGMTTLAFLQVVLRNFFHFGFLWADPLLRYCVVWVGFLGAALASREEKHFGIEFLNRFLRPKTLHAVRSIISVFAVVISIMLLRASIQFLAEGFSADETDVFDIPKRFYFAVIPAGFGLVALHFAVHFLRHVRGIFSGEPDASEPVSSQGIV